MYFREHLREEVQKFLNKKENHKANGSPYNLYTDGLKIYTTIDSRLQTFGEDAIKEHLQTLQMYLFIIIGIMKKIFRTLRLTPTLDIFKLIQYTSLL